MWVIDDVTARAVNIAGFQFITLIRHLTHNRASGCNINNLTLTTSVAKSATWGKPMNPRGINRGAVAHPAAKNYLWMFFKNIYYDTANNLLSIITHYLVPNGAGKGVIGVVARCLPVHCAVQAALKGILAFHSK